jgi:protein-tyrosine phosphatase
MRSVLFVCTANICRSPMARGVLSSLTAGKDLLIDAAGTHDYYVGKPPFPQAVEVARRRGYDITQYLARQVTGHDFDRFDVILAMAGEHLEHLRAMAPSRCRQKIELFLEYGEAFHEQDVPDPFGRSDLEFERTLDRIEDGCRGLARVLLR